MSEPAEYVAVPRADLILLLDWWMYPHAWKRAQVAPAAERTKALIENAQSWSDATKVAVCEYLLQVNKDMDGAFIPPTAFDWLGNGIVDAILGTLIDGCQEVPDGG